MTELGGQYLRNIQLLNDGNTPYEFTNEQGKYFWDTYESENR